MDQARDVAVDGGVPSCCFDLFIGGAVEAVVFHVHVFLIYVLVVFLVPDAVVVVEGCLLNWVILEILMTLSSKKCVLFWYVLIREAVVDTGGISVITLLGVPKVIVNPIALLDGVDVGGEGVDLIHEVGCELFEALFHHLKDGGHLRQGWHGGLGDLNGKVSSRGQGVATWDVHVNINWERDQLLQVYYLCGEGLPVRIGQGWGA